MTKATMSLRECRGSVDLRTGKDFITLVLNDPQLGASRYELRY